MDVTQDEGVIAPNEAPSPTEPRPPAPSEPGGALWATTADLDPAQGWEDTVLPERGQWVRVRYLSTPEVARLQFLPDLTNFTELVAALGQGGEAAAKVDRAEYAEENYRYLARLAHVAIMDPLKDPTPVPCPHCTVHEGDKPKVIKHPPSLWSPAQTEFLRTGDLNHVAAVALRVREVTQSLGPFSRDEQQGGSRQPVDTGE